MELSKKVIQDIKNETAKALEFAKIESTKLFDNATDAAKEKLENISTTATNAMQEISESANKIREDVMKDLDRISREALEAIERIKEEAIETINRIFKEFKVRAETIYGNAVLIVGTSVIEESLKQLLRLLDKVSKNCVEGIQEVATDTTKQIEKATEETKRKAEDPSAIDD